MVLLGCLAASEAEAQTKVRAALTSGRGLDNFRKMIAEQGGDPRIVDDPALLPTAPMHLLLHADRSGYVVGVHAELVGFAAMMVGAGRDRVIDEIDHAVGVRILARPGEAMAAGDAFAEVHYRNDNRLAEAVTLLQRAWTIGDAPPAETPLIVERIA
jgi:pyrimidine-nucleoside phosphorylase